MNSHNLMRSPSKEICLVIKFNCNLDTHRYNNTFQTDPTVIYSDAIDLYEHDCVFLKLNGTLRNFFVLIHNLSDIIMETLGDKLIQCKFFPVQQRLTGSVEYVRSGEPGTDEILAAGGNVGPTKFKLT